MRPGGTTFLTRDVRAVSAREVGPPQLSKSVTLNGSPFGCDASSIFCLLPGGMIVSSTASNGLSILGSDPIATTSDRDKHPDPISRIDQFSVGKTVYVVSSSASTIKIWCIQDRKGTIYILFCSAIPTKTLIPEHSGGRQQSIKYVAFCGQILLVVTSSETVIRFEVVAAASGIRFELRKIDESGIQLPPRHIVQSVASFDGMNAVLCVGISGDRGCSLFLANFEKDAADKLKLLEIRATGGKLLATLTTNFTVFSIDLSKIQFVNNCTGDSTEFRPPGSFKEGKISPSKILAVISNRLMEGNSFFCLTDSGSLLYYAIIDGRAIFQSRIANLEKIHLTAKCTLQIGGDTVMVSQPSDDGSVQMLTFPIPQKK